MATTQGGRRVTGPGGPITTGANNGASVSEREDLANFISMITRDETPFQASIGKTKADAIFHEWQTDELAAPADSKIAEGVDYAQPGSAAVSGEYDTGFTTAGPNRTRIGNYCQINGKVIGVSGTRRAIDQAGVADEYAYQLKKRGTELRRDLERDMVGVYQAASSATTIRTMGGYSAFINDPKTVELNGATVNSKTAPADPITDTDFRSGRHAVTLTGSRSALSLADIDSVMQKIYEEGGKATKVMLSPKLRRDFSDLMVTDSGVRRNIDMDGKLRQSVDVYMSDFGDLMVVPNYIMGLDHGTSGNAAVGDSAALIYDPQWFAVATLRPMQEVDVGQRGDSTVGQLVEECTLEVKNPLGCGAIYNLA